MEKGWFKNMFYAYWFVIFTLRMHPGLSVSLFQIVCIRHWKLRLKAQLSWKTRTSPRKEMLQFQNLVPFCVKMKLQTFQNTFTSSEEVRNDNSALLGCNRSGYHCFPDSGTSRLEPGLCASCVGYWLFWATADFSLTWHLQGISVLTVMMSEQRSDFPGQMRFFCLWLLLKCPHLLGLLAGF